MKIVFVSNFYNHHQASFSCWMDELTNHNYHFISTAPMDEERKTMGWGGIRCPDFVIDYNDSPTECTKIIDEADVVIFGSAPYELFKPRLKAGKLTIMYSERLYKTGYQAWKLPLRLWRFWKKYGRYKNLYLLCASAFSAADYAKTCTFLNKAYKWGYFPPFDKREGAEALIKKKATETVEILYVSRLIPLKHPELPLQIAAKLMEDKISFHLTMVGNGEMKQKVEEAVEHYGLTAHVTMIDSLPSDRVRDYMDRANIFLFTSDRNEGWGAVMNESMGSACAVVASSEIGSVPFLVQDGQNGLIYRDGDFNDLYEKVKTLCVNQILRERMGTEAYLTISETWNAEIAAKRFLELVEDIKEKGRSDRFLDGPCSKAAILKDGWYQCK